MRAGPIFKIKIFRKEMVFVGNAALADEVCNSGRFRKCLNMSLMDEIRRTVHDALFSAYDNEPNWAIARRIMAPSVSPSTDDVRVSELQDMVSELTAKWTSNPGQSVDVTDDLYRLDLQSVVYCFFNQRFNYLDGEKPSILKTMDNITSEMAKRSNRARLLNWLLHDRRFNRDVKELRKFGADMIDAKKAEQIPKRDMLYVLIHDKDPGSGQSLDHERIIDEIVTIMITAATTTGLMSGAMYYLLANPHVMAKAREEVDHVLGSDGQITPTTLNRKFPYCEAILNETLRHASTVQGFFVEPDPAASSSSVLLAGGKYEIPKNQLVTVLLTAINRDPEVFDDPAGFRPERMLGEAYDNLPAGAKKWFGNGKRHCYGKRFAWQLSMTALITVLRSVDMEMADKEYELKQSGTFFQSPDGLFALVRPRGNN